MTVKDFAFDLLRVFARNTLESEAKPVFTQFVAELTANPAAFDRVYQRLADDESRRVFEWAVKFRLAAFLAKSRHEAERLAPPRLTRSRWLQLLQEVRDIPEAELENNIDIDLIENYALDGYNLAGLCSVEPGDIVLDLGAFNGNSTIVLARRATGGKVYAFEPNPSTCESLARNLARMQIDNAEVVPCGISNAKGTLKFVKEGAASRFSPTGDISVEVTTVDDFVAEQGLARVDFIKLDIEGFESKALKGARETLLFFRPKLAVSIYHMYDDFISLPQMIEDYGGWYDFYLRHNAITGGEIVLFCRPAGH